MEAVQQELKDYLDWAFQIINMNMINQPEIFDSKHMYLKLNKLWFNNYL